MEIVAAQKPDQPSVPTTAILDRWSVVIDWVAPYDGGVPITSYTIQIRTADASIFDLDLVDCDGSSSVIMAATTCTI